VVEVPEEATLLPKDVHAVLASFEGLVCLEPGLNVRVPAVREIVTTRQSLVCPDCLAETGWDDFQWKLFAAGMAELPETA
jgi:hypothetical protein